MFNMSYVIRFYLVSVPVLAESAVWFQPKFRFRPIPKMDFRPSSVSAKTVKIGFGRPLLLAAISAVSGVFAYYPHPGTQA